MLRSFTLTLGQLGDRAILGVLAKSLLITLLICVGLGFAIGYAGQYGAQNWIDRAYQGSTFDTFAVIIRGLALILIVFFGFRLVAVPVIGFFADEVVAAIERRHYPAAAQAAKHVTIAVSLRLGVASVLRLIGLNLLALPVYAVLVFTAIGPVIAFAIVNALLLGRDLGEMVAVRHLDPAGVKQWLRMTRGSRAIMGLAVTGLFMVPFVNLLAPIVGAGIATHLFHGRRD